MNEDNKKVSGKYPEEVERIVDGLTLFDDDLMSRVFEKNIKATELVLRIIFGRPIKVKNVIGQDVFKSQDIEGRSITLDIHAIDTDGKEIDIEVQGNEDGSDVKRARYYSSMLDSRMLKKGEKFSNIKDSYVIFIYRYYKFEKGLPIYHLTRFVEETGEQVGDGSYIIYLNGTYTGNDDFGKLMSDFKQRDFRKMNFPELADGVRFFKEDEGGQLDMCDAVKEYGIKCGRIEADRANVNAVRNLMINYQISLDQAMNAIGLQGKERQAVEDELKKKDVS